MTPDHELGSLADEVEALAERVADRALELLRAAVADGRDDAARLEKVVTRARRALEKAASLLRGAA